MWLVVQQLRTLRKHPSSPPFLGGGGGGGGGCSIFSFLCSVLSTIDCLSVFFFLLDIMLSVHLWFMASDYRFGILNYFSKK